MYMEGSLIIKLNKKDLIYLMTSSFQKTNSNVWVKSFFKYSIGIFWKSVVAILMNFLDRFFKFFEKCRERNHIISSNSWKLIEISKLKEPSIIKKHSITSLLKYIYV
jgi:hypothetical protein